MFDQARIPIISTKIGYRTLIVAVGPLFAEFDKWFIGEEKTNYAPPDSTQLKLVNQMNFIAISYL
jgi:hypothetical protein